MDCRPPTGEEVDIDMVPEHMRETVLKRRAERAAAAARTAGNDNQASDT
jgi:hypothetical protein